MVQLRTSTPADGTGEFANTLDPALELYDPSGTVVASNDDGAPDGRNASLQYAATVGGAYKVRVFATADTSGEYVLFLNRLPSASAGPDQAGDEGQVFTFAGTGADPDGDPLTFLWDFGDGQTAAGPTVAHAYADNGLYTVTLTVDDGHGGMAASPLTVTVDNVDPTVSILGAPAGSPEGVEIVLGSNVVDPGWADTHTYAWQVNKNGAVYASGSGEAIAFTPDDDAVYTVSLAVTDDDGGVGTDSVAIPVYNVAPAVSADRPAQLVQYSDPILPVTITASDVAADVLTASASGLPNGLSLAAAAAPRTWVIAGTADAAPGTYQVTVTVADEDGGKSDYVIQVDVAQENALVGYTGALFASTSSARATTATVMLAATVRDITAADPAGDANPGDVRNATVRFRVYDAMTGALVAVIPSVPVGLVDPADCKIGVATYNWTADIGSADAKTYRVVAEATAYYTGISSPDLITVSKPLDNSVSGGGYLINQACAGSLAGDPGLKTSFGFNVKTNKNGAAKGSVVIFIRRMEPDGIVHTYQVRSTVIQSFSTRLSSGTAVFNGKASIQDITDPLNPVSIDGNASLQITLTDQSNRRGKDAIAITLWNKQGGLYYSSYWNGARTLEDFLDGGNLQVR